mmetsp:Transcript_22608/g.33061  ORF Transcript_22608/g.33061 Transcript_22608/m.33061 type:complete len:101 (+) Transcript_22608:77-379(+)
MSFHNLLSTLNNKTLQQTYILGPSVTNTNKHSTLLTPGECYSDAYFLKFMTCPRSPRAITQQLSSVAANGCFQYLDPVCRTTAVLLLTPCRGDDDDSEDL